MASSSSSSSSSSPSYVEAFLTFRKKNKHKNWSYEKARTEFSLYCIQEKEKELDCLIEDQKEICMTAEKVRLLIDPLKLEIDLLSQRLIEWSLYLEKNKNTPSSTKTKSLRVNETKEEEKRNSLQVIELETQRMFRLISWIKKELNNKKKNKKMEINTEDIDNVPSMRAFIFSLQNKLQDPLLIHQFIIRLERLEDDLITAKELFDNQTHNFI